MKKNGNHSRTWYEEIVCWLLLFYHHQHAENKQNSKHSHADICIHMHARASLTLYWNIAVDRYCIYARKEHFVCAAP